MTDALFNDRFWFLDEDQRAIVKAILDDPDSSGVLIDIVRELAIQVELDAEWERINTLTPAQLDAELRAAGHDPAEMTRRCEALIARLRTESQSKSP